LHLRITLSKMALNIQNMIHVIEQKITATSSHLEIVKLSNVLKQLKLNSVYSIDTFLNLPAAVDNEGNLYYVEDEKLIYWSDSSIWISLFAEHTELWTWGENTNGALGENTTTSRSSPGTTVTVSLTWKYVAGGNLYTVASKTDGTLWTWGDNQYGNLGDNSTTSRRSPITTIGGGTNWDNIAAGVGQTLAIKTDGTLWTWGRNSYGQLADGTTTSRLSPGTVAGGGTNWNNVASGDNHSLSTKTDGTLWVWGQNTDGRLGDGTTTSRLSPVTTSGGGTNWNNIAGGDKHSLATKTDGTLWTWGENALGRLGDNSTVDKSSPVTTAGGGTNWNNVAGGNSFSVATKTDGTLWTWGAGFAGKLGDGTTTNRSSPGTTAGGGTTWDKVDCGFWHALATKTDGTLWTWGNADDGQLGDNTNVDKSSPVTTAGGGTNWNNIACGWNHSIATKTYTD
jgi:alpha-tubulin suppressor-like RCC1 family protein